MHVISQAQGRIALVSEEGKGTLVAMFMPKGFAVEGTVESESVKNILLIDDNDDWAKLFTQLLKDTKIKLNQITDVKKIPSADLIFVDENITSVALKDVLSALAKENVLSKTVVLTSAINPERVTQYLRDGVKDVTVKPYSVNEVSELLK
ncbi:MAG: Response regulator receiver domain protein [Chloroflexi bacterium OLB14]|nr:MAG: Response regulator receiver domain protein [Chloroflexi bacterium OLB14]